MPFILFFFFFNDTATTEIYTLSLHDALPISGNQQGPTLLPALESIGEIKVLLTNYQAEYGRNYGGSVTTVTKAGTKQFHGGGYYFKRNEALNANDYFPNRDGWPRAF